MSKQKTLEQQLADARAKQGRIKARLAQLQVRKKLNDQRKRAQGSMCLMRVILDQAETEQSFKEQMCSLVSSAAILKPQEREAALWVLAAPNEQASASPDVTLSNASP